MKYKVIILVIVLALSITFLSSCKQETSNTAEEPHQITAENIYQSNTTENFLDDNNVVVITTTQYSISEPLISKIYLEKKGKDIWVYGDNPETGTKFVLSPNYYYTLLDPVSESGEHLGVQENMAEISRDEYKKMLDDYKNIIDIFTGENLNFTSIEENDSIVIAESEQKIENSNQYGSYYQSTYGVKEDNITILRTLELEKENLRLKSLSTRFKTETVPETLESITLIEYLSGMPNLDFIPKQ